MKSVFSRIRVFYKKHRGFKKLLLWSSTTLVVLFVLIVVAAEVTSQPPFCKTCHYMEPFYESWKESLHKDVTCVKCHFPPGLAGTVRGKLEGLVQVVNYVSQSYVRRRPWAEISDESCLQSGCHETRLLSGQVTFKNGIHFDHAPHLTELKRGKKLRCTSCHSQIVQGNHIAVTEETCFLCHFKKDPLIDLIQYGKISNCKTCHRWENVKAADMSKYRFDHTEVVKQRIDCVRCHGATIMGDGAVPKERCFSCHWDQARLSQYANTDFLHQMHIAEHKIECLNCHLNIQHKVQRVDANAPPECTTCHEGFHESQVKLFSGHGGSGVEDTPSPMFKSGLNCASCHIFHRNMTLGKVKTARPQSCEGCHGKGFGNLLAQWKKTTQVNLDRLNRIYRDVVDSIKNMPNKHKIELQKLLDSAYYNIHLVEVGKSVHNIEYSERLLGASYEYIKKAVKFASPPYELPVFKGSSVNVPSECASCHYGIGETKVEVYGITFSHSRHAGANRIACVTCHSNAKKHGELVMEKEGCTSCHHKRTTNVDCQNCHQLENEFYGGGYMGLSQPNVMESGVGCVDCHLSNQKVVKPSGSVCLNCHEKGYDETMTKWQQATKKQVDDIKRLTLSLKSVNLSPALKKSLEAVDHLIVDIEKSSAWGVHNYEMISTMLARKQKELSQFTISN